MNAAVPAAHKVRCPTCTGTGEVSVQPTLDPQSAVDETCPDCEGTCRVALTERAVSLEVAALLEAIDGRHARYGRRADGHGEWSDLAHDAGEAPEWVPLAEVWAVLEAVGNAEPRWEEPVSAELQARVEAWFATKEAA